MALLKVKSYIGMCVPVMHVHEYLFFYLLELYIVVIYDLLLKNNKSCTYFIIHGWGNGDTEIIKVWIYNCV